MTTAIAFTFGALTALALRSAIIRSDADAALVILSMWVLFTLYMFTA
jgi:hypothetical protein